MENRLKVGKGRPRKLSYCNPDGVRMHGTTLLEMVRFWMYVMLVLTEFAAGLDLWWKRGGGVKNDSRAFDQSTLARGEEAEDSPKNQNPSVSSPQALNWKNWKQGSGACYGAPRGLNALCCF